MYYLFKKRLEEQKLSKLDIEITDELDFEIGDCCIVIKRDGTIGKLILPEMRPETVKTEGYKKMLKIIDMLKPGAKKEFVKHNKRSLH